MEYTKDSFLSGALEMVKYYHQMMASVLFSSAGSEESTGSFIIMFSSSGFIHMPDSSPWGAHAVRWAARKRR